MKPGVLPAPPPLLPLHSISPSTFIALRECPLRAVWYANRSTPPLPSGPSAAIGTVTHRVFELAARGQVTSREAFDEMWADLVAKEETRLGKSWSERQFVPFRDSVRTFEQKRELCWIALEKLSLIQPLNLSCSKGRSSSTEVWLETADKACGGKADQISFDGHNIEIIDFKSTSLIPGDSGKEAETDAYQLQVRFYAALYHAARKVWPTSLKIIASGGIAFEVPFTHKECEGLLKDAYTSLAHTNCVIRQNAMSTKTALNKLARPSPSSCKYCRFRPVCPPYWEERERPPEQDWPLDFRGSVTSIGPWGHSEGKVYLDLTINGKNESIKIVDISRDRHPAISRQNGEVQIFSLRKYKKHKNTFRQSDYTTMFRPDTPE